MKNQFRLKKIRVTGSAGGGALPLEGEGRGDDGKEFDPSLSNTFLWFC